MSDSEEMKGALVQGQRKTEPDCPVWFFLFGENGKRKKNFFEAGRTPKIKGARRSSGYVLVRTCRRSRFLGGIAKRTVEETPCAWETGKAFLKLQLWKFLWLDISDNPKATVLKMVRRFV